MSRIVYFIFAFLITFSPIPILGIITQERIFDTSIFNYSYSLYLLGYSADSNKTLLGNDGWMFLGDAYSRSFSKSKPDYLEDQQLISNHYAFLDRLKEILEDKNLPFYQIVTPSKYSIYGEHIKLKTTPASYSYYENNRKTKEYTLIHHLRELKQESKMPFFLKTDSHWNHYGAFIGYQFLMKEVLENKYNSIKENLPFTEKVVGAGDLARFLNLLPYISDVDFHIEPSNQSIIKRNLTSGVEGSYNISHSLTNQEIKQPILISNTSALNKIKVLWIHDSFGHAMSTYMHQTFTETIHQHYGYAFKNIDTLKTLISSQKPDIVILSYTERDAFLFGDFLNNFHQ